MPWQYGQVIPIAFTPVLDNGIQVATDVYRQMMLYLANNNNSGHMDWTQPSGLYRSGSYLT